MKTTVTIEPPDFLHRGNASAMLCSKLELWGASSDTEGFMEQLAGSGMTANSTRLADNLTRSSLRLMEQCIPTPFMAERRQLLDGRKQCCPRADFIWLLFRRETSLKASDHAAAIRLRPKYHIIRQQGSHCPLRTQS
jgi:hypothetical protein